MAGAARAQSPDLGAPSIGILPPPDILELVRYLGLDPTGEPVRRGAYYVLHAYDRAGIAPRRGRRAVRRRALHGPGAEHVADASLRAGGAHHPGCAPRKRGPTKKVVASNE